MKKTLLKLLLLVLPLAAVTVSCDNDDFKEDDLIGRWDLAYEYELDKEDGVVVYENGENVPSGSYIMQFKKDGTGIDSDDDTFTWRLSGKRLYINWGSEDVSSTIEKLTSNQFVVSWTESGTDEGVSYKDYYQQTYNKL